MNKSQRANEEVYVANFYLFFACGPTVFLAKKPIFGRVTLKPPQLLTSAIIGTEPSEKFWFCCCPFFFLLVC